MRCVRIDSYKPPTIFRPFKPLNWVGEKMKRYLNKMFFVLNFPRLPHLTELNANLGKRLGYNRNKHVLKIDPSLLNPLYLDQPSQEKDQRDEIKESYIGRKSV